MRRNIVRYAVLAYVITLKHVSIRVKKRFPTLQHIVDAGEYSIKICVYEMYTIRKRAILVRVRRSANIRLAYAILSVW